MPRSYEDREAQGRLKLHLLMARLRTGLRAVMSDFRDWRIPNWKINVRDELVSNQIVCFGSHITLTLCFDRSKY